MKRVPLVIAVPVYAVAIGIEVCVLAYKLVRWERGLQRAAKDAAAQHRDDLRRERECAANLADESEWGVN
jgi:hypothetical protein